MKIEKLNMILESREKFFYFCKKCNDNFRSITPSLYLYKKIIEKHRLYRNLEELLEDNEFLELVYATLKAWGMDSRKSELVEFNDFKKSIINNKDTIIALNNYKLDNITPENLGKALSLIETLFINMKVTNQKSKVVGLSKTLHFLLPDLVMPIDRTYTMDFFYGYNKYNPNFEKEFETFKEIFNEFYKIIKKLNLNSRDVDGIAWNTSLPKLIDNAIIGAAKNPK